MSVSELLLRQTTLEAGGRLGLEPSGWLSLLVGTLSRAAAPQCGCSGERKPAGVLSPGVPDGENLLAGPPGRVSLASQRTRHFTVAAWPQFS